MGRISIARVWHACRLRVERRGRARRPWTSAAASRWRRPGSLAGVAVATSLSLLAVACDATSSAGVRSSTPSIRTPEAPAPRLRIVPADGTTNADPAAGVSVRAVRGTITGVTIQTQGDRVEGRLDPGGARWHSVWALNVDTSYTVRATAVDPAGRTISTTSTFRTIDPPHTFTTTIFEGYRKTYGVGMPVILTFSQPIVRKRAVERSLELRSSNPVVGAWYWDGDRTLYFRPRIYWPPHTVVRFVGHLNGVEAAPGVYGVHTLTQRFRIGRSLIAIASTDTHHVRIYLDRHLFGDWPMSAGRPGDDTPNGTYLTMEKNNPEEMIGPGYDIEVPWSVRFTNSGDFLHDAYWSVGQQGFDNVSHGCVNLSPEHARTYYQLAVQGDPVTITGSPRAGTWGNGWTVWFLTFGQLVRGSALDEAVRVGPGGSSFVERSALRPLRARPPLLTARPGNAAAT